MFTFDDSFLNRKDRPLMQNAINDLLSKSAITKVEPCVGQFLLTYFLVPKPNGKQRFVLNLKKLNSFIAINHLKMEDIRTAVKLMSDYGFMASLNLQDVYFLILLHEASRKYLQFQWKGKIYEYTCIPFGLNTPLWLYTKIIKPAANYFREKGLLSVV